MKKDDLIQKSDNTKVDVGTAELTRWKAPFVPNYYEGEREYKKGNYTNPHAIAHEAGHAVTNNQIKKEIEGFGNLKYSGRSNYFTKNNWTELSQRGSQIKNYFGLTKSNQEVTPEMLEYAYQNYIKDTGINNNMGEFFFSITDFQKAAKWITENSLKNGGKIE